MSPYFSICLLYALSGGCSLIYQLVWFHDFVDFMGTTGSTLVIVLSCFIGGLGAGALCSKRVYDWVGRRLHLPGLRAYAATEFLITLSVPLLLVLTRMPLRGIIGSFPYELTQTAGGLPLFTPVLSYRLLRLATSVIAVGLPCFLMGLTYPLLCKIYRGSMRFPSLIYSYNTFGACTAILIVEFWLFRILGYHSTLIVALSVNLVLALVAWWLPAPQVAKESPEKADYNKAKRAEQRAGTYFPVIATGFLTGGLQAAAFAFIKLTYGATKGMFSFLSLFAIFGIWLAARLVHDRPPSKRVLVGTATIGIGWMATIWALEPHLSLRLIVQSENIASSFSPYFAGLVVTLLVTGQLILVPYCALSMVLPSVCDRTTEEVSIHQLYGWNTMSFLVGVLVFGYLAPHVNPFYGFRMLFGLGVITIISLAILDWSRPIPWRHALAVAAAVTFVVLLTPSKLDMRLIGGMHVPEVPIDWRSTPQHMFWVQQLPGQRSKILMFDRHPMSGDNDMSQRYMRVMAHAPLLMHPAPKEALLICFGVGATCDAIRKHQTIERVDVVDLNSAVFDLNNHFAESNDTVLADERLRLIVDDGRQFLKLTDTTYDLVTLEPPPPLKVGISRLYSQEFYADVKRHLSPDGIVSQWLPESSVNAEAVQLIISTFVNAFAESIIIAGSNRVLVLVGSERSFELAHVYKRLVSEDAVRSDLRRYGIYNANDVLGLIMHAPDTMLQRWSDKQFIHDGFLSLEAIMVSPVQGLYGSDNFESAKADLVLDLGVLQRYLTEQLGELAPSVFASICNPEFSAMDYEVVSQLYYAESTVARTRHRSIISGYNLLANNENDQAMMIANELTDTWPEHPDVLNFLGCVLAVHGDRQRAAVAFRKVLDLAPENRSASAFLARLEYPAP